MLSPLVWRKTIGNSNAGSLRINSVSVSWKSFKRPYASRDRNFCDDIDRSINSACHNTAEGFYKFKHKLFAASLRIARGELGETRDQLKSAAQMKYITATEHAELELLCRRALGANGGMLQFLEKNPDR